MAELRKEWLHFKHSMHILHLDESGEPRNIKNKHIFYCWCFGDNIDKIRQALIVGLFNRKELK